jgi:transposase
MSRVKVCMVKIREILRLSELNISKREISRIMKVSRPVVNNYLKLFELRGLTNSVVSNYSDEALSEILFPNEVLVPDKKKRLYKLFTSFSKELKRTGVTLRILWEEYKLREEDHYCYSQFCSLYSSWDAQSEISMHQEMKAGDKLFIDYCGDKLYITDRESNNDIPVEVFVSILGASQMIYAEASYHQKLSDVIRSTENSMLYYGGVPKVIVPDNMKTAVNKSDKYEPEINSAIFK